MKVKAPGRQAGVGWIPLLALLALALLLVFPAVASADVALSSISIGPDLGGAENVGSAMSAEIDLLDETPISVPDGTPTTISCTSTVPDPECPEEPVTPDTTVASETTVPVTSTSAAASSTTSVIVPSVIHAGGGGTAGASGLWFLLAVGGSLALGLAASTLIIRGTSRI